MMKITFQKFEKLSISILCAVSSGVSANDLKSFSPSFYLINVKVFPNIETKCLSFFFCDLDKTERHSLKISVTF